MEAIKAEGISKTYNRGRFSKGTIALDDLSIIVNQGEIFGFLGPNGAGKTTLLKILLNIIYPTVGNAQILGMDVRNPQARREVGYLPENPYFYDRMNGYQLLEYYGQIYRMNSSRLNKRKDEVLATVGLVDAAKRPLRGYSKGMLQRIGLAQAILSEPKLVFLDEPSTGLDPMGRRKIKDVILNLKANGTTVFLNSHILADVEDTCDRVGIVKEGKLIKVAGVQELTTDLHRIVIRLEKADETLGEKLAGLVTKFKVMSPDEMEMSINSPERIPEVISKLVEIGIRIYEVRYYKISLEDIFISIMDGGGKN